MKISGGTPPGTTKLLVLIAVPEPAVTEIGPVVAPPGTMATIWVVELTAKTALTPLKLTPVGLIKLVPSSVTFVPGKPLPGANPVIVGVELDAPLVIKLCEILKKMLPTASTLIRALPLGVPGIVTASDPSL